MQKKLTIVEINSVPFGSTGSIMLNIAEEARKAGHKVYVCYPNGRHNPSGRLQDAIFIGGRISEDLHILLHRLTGLNGYFSRISTRLFLRKLKKINPDIIHLHNLHNCYINLPMLFDFIRENKIRVVWTLHDCWALTGHCPHFDYTGCEKWKTGCGDCPVYREYPESLRDTSSLLWKKKREWFSGVEDLTIATPSKWLADMVGQSFLKEYPVKVIYSGIDLDVFKPVESDFKERTGIADSFMLLGVSMEWSEEKGIDVFGELSKRLGPDCRIVLVSARPGQEQTLPENIVRIGEVANGESLAEIYSAADVLVNPTRGETLGLVNIEALACGTPVVTFASGGSPECVDPSCGIVVPKDDVDAMAAAVEQIRKGREFSREACRKRALGFDRKDSYAKYVRLYETGEPEGKGQKG